MDDFEEKSRSVLTALGALVEMSAFLRDQLVANGYTREEACKIAGDFIISLTRNNGRN